MQGLYDYSFLTDYLNELTGLSAPNVPIHFKNSDGDVERCLFFDYGILPQHWAGLTETELDERKRSWALKRDGEGVESPDIFNLMGVYKSHDDDPFQSEIVIYDNVISSVAKELDVDPYLLTELEVIHLKIYAVIHIGRDDSGRIWERFEEIANSHKEIFAQLYTRFLLRYAGNGDRLSGYRTHMMSWKLGSENRMTGKQERIDEFSTSDYFTTLSLLAEKQLPTFKRWEATKFHSPQEVNALLRSARKVAITMM
jgi:hypothetical protein